MKIKAGAKYLRLSPRKVRLVASPLVGLPVSKVILMLKVASKKPASHILKVIKQGVANAKNNFKITGAEDLRVIDIRVQEGPRIKRLDKSHGARFDRGIIKKKFCHIEVILESQEKKEVIVKKEENGK